MKRICQPKLKIKQQALREVLFSLISNRNILLLDYVLVISAWQLLLFLFFFLDVCYIKKYIMMRYLFESS